MASMGASAPLPPVITGLRVSGRALSNLGPFATFSCSSPAPAGRPVTLTFSGPSGGSAFRYSFDFNNDGDFSDPGEVRDATTPSVSYTFTRRGWQVVRGRVMNAQGIYTDFWVRVFAQ